MQKTKTHTLIVRGVEKSKKNKLKVIARKHKRSVNYIMLHAVDYYLGNDVSIEKELSDIEKAMK
jgi:hypothetical protein